MPKIRILPDALASQIAAGEVVERPSSVVKELVENSLDAGAASIRVELQEGGRRLIVVADDGTGMGAEDALLAFDRHATSKIGRFEDLEEVATFGFRGEALASIASVARVDLLTAGGDEGGHQVRVDAGRVRSAQPAARARGTTVAVESLFWNVPARRKFLRSSQTELRRVLETLQGMALARPDVVLRVEHDGKMILDLPARASLAERLADVFGEAFAHGLVAIDDPAGAIGGFLGGPRSAGGRRSLVFVNGRLVRDRAVLGAFHRAVREVWRSDDAPSLLLDLRLPPASVDVNVHPQKAEVRFRDPRFVGRVEERLREALERARGETRPLGESLRVPGGELTRVPLSWRGLGAGIDPGEVREGEPAFSTWSRSEAVSTFARRAAHDDPAAPRIAQVALRPLDRLPVPLSGRGAPVQHALRLLGQYKGSLLLLEGPEGLVVIDQHVAHERVLYERLREELRGGTVAAQRLVEPLLLSLAPAERERLLAAAGSLGQLGFELSELSGGALGIAALPSSLDPAEAEGLLVRLASGGLDQDDASPEEGVEELRRRLLDAWAASRACRAAVKMHQTMSPAAIEALVGDLFACEQPFACPHGRPIILTLSDAELERRFERR